MNPKKQANCLILGDGSDAVDFAHIRTTTPQRTKRDQILSARQAGIDPVREHATTVARRDGTARPHGGGAAKK